MPPGRMVPRSMRTVRVSGPDWYARWFGEEYLRLYPHRDQGEADLAVELTAGLLELGEKDRVLDLACGAGRHLRAMAERGIRGIGLDLSHPLLLRAREAIPGTPLVRADMRRIPFAEGAFSLVSSFFTSFGYFTSPAEDRMVLEEVRRVLRPGGHLVLDFMNSARVREGLVPRDEREVDGRTVIQERRLVDGGAAVEKTIRMGATEGEDDQRFVERVRLYDPDELEDLLVSAGLSPIRSFGDYQGTAFTAESPRFILLAQLPVTPISRAPVSPTSGSPAVVPDHPVPRQGEPSFED